MKSKIRNWDIKNMKMKKLNQKLKIKNKYKKKKIRKCRVLRIDKPILVNLQAELGAKPQKNI